ncbi:hypothetical protein HMPREF0971_01488 [Segatella oris F0302]|uniref:Uncharacterized protein n=1 Tax=Segatella oris F0302 TaxID=649760 RepID=D1QR85_9BACT|nr:hypothetical protein HMPREF0971_01488 [Segatella oris F0302]
MSGAELWQWAVFSKGYGIKPPYFASFHFVLSHSSSLPFLSR